MANFVSSKDIEAVKCLKKQEKREAREIILRKAKKDHEKRERRNELSKQRGEDTWTAPGIINRLALDSHGKSKHKRKKHRKEKQAKLTVPRDSSSDTCSPSDEEMWVERGQLESTPSAEIAKSMSTLKRDTWMTVPLEPSEKSLVTITSKDEKNKPIEKLIISPLDNPGRHPRELNPYWRDGGCGLPEEKQSHDKVASRTGDGGRSWILRSYKRALEQAESEGKDLSEIASKRWGSLEKLYSLLNAAGIDVNNPDKKPSPKQRECLYAAHTRPRNEEQNPKKHYSNKTKDRKSCNTKSFQAPLTFLKPDSMQPEHSDNSNYQKHALVANIDFSKKSGNWEVMSEKRCKEESNIHSLGTSSLDSNKTEDKSQLGTSTHSVCVTHEHKITDSELNSLSAKVLKAEMLGDTVKVSALMENLEKLRELKKLQEKESSELTTQSTGKSSEKVIPLVTFDRFGRTRPLDIPVNEASGRSQINYPSHSRKGKHKRGKFSSEDENYTLQALVEQERKMSAKDTQLAIANMAAKFVSPSNVDDTIDERYASRVAVSYDPRQNKEKEKNIALHESLKLSEHLQRCRFCFGNDNFCKNTLIALGINVYLAVPYSKSLTNGHCLLIPMEHNTSMILLDENVWEEVKIFQKGLIRMFDDHGMDVVFTESYMSASSKSHAYIECIPLPKDQGNLAPLYFKKAILECDEEWSMNRKLISTKERGVRQSLPVGLPYFFVEFGGEGGFAHIIEDQTQFPAYFAREVIGGIMDVEPRLWLKPPKDSFESLKRKVLKISEWWKPYDWTQKIKNHGQ